MPIVVLELGSGGSCDGGDGGGGGGGGGGEVALTVIVLFRDDQIRTRVAGEVFAAEAAGEK